MSSKEQGLLGAVARGAEKVAFYPLEHPLKTAKFVAIGGMAIAAPLITVQLSMLSAEHGSSRPTRQPDLEQTDEYQETPTD